MPSNEELDDLDDDVEDDVVGEADDEDQFEDDDEDDLDENEDEADDEIRGSTAEVGSEGGSPGEAVESVSRNAGLGSGSERSETWRPGTRDREEDSRRDEEGTLIKRAP